MHIIFNQKYVLSEYWKSEIFERKSKNTKKPTQVVTAVQEESYKFSEKTYVMETKIEVALQRYS